MALTPVPTIDTALPVPPNPADEESVFDAKAYAWSNALPGFGGDVKAIGDATYANAQWAQTKALEAAEQVPLAAAQVDLAAAQVYLATEQADLATSNGAAQVALAAAQVSIAAGHASDAADSATAASASATEAAGLVEKYQGALAADPVLDKSGGPLTDGDWYVSTVTGVIRAYTVVGGWVNGLSAVAGVTSVNGNSGAITGVVTETGAQSLTEKTLVNPLLFLGGSNGTAGQVPISQGPGLPVIWGSGSEIICSVRTSNTSISAANKGNLIDITSGTFTQTFSAASTLGNGWFCYVRNSGTGDITLDPNASEQIDGVTSGLLKPGMTLLIQCDGSALNAVRIDNQTITEVKTSGTSWTCPIGVRRVKIRMSGGGASGGGTTAGGSAGGYLEKTLIVSPGIYTYAIGSGGAGVSSGAFGRSGGTTVFTANGVQYAAYGGNAANESSANPGGTAVNGDLNIQGGSGGSALGCDPEATQPLGGGNPLSGVVGGGSVSSKNGIGYGGGGAPRGMAESSGSGAQGVLILEY